MTVLINAKSGKSRPVIVHSMGCSSANSNSNNPATSNEVGPLDEACVDIAEGAKPERKQVARR